jgi:L-alanine-DL-glutamate epimerase-like enolase superfamily enzyme
MNRDMKLTHLSIHSQRIAIPRSRISLTEAPRNDSVDFLAVELNTDSGLTGLGFTYTQGGGSAALRSLIEVDFAPQVIGENAHNPERITAKVRGKFESLGWGGLLTRAYAAIDIALWDLRAKAAQLPLYQFLGGARGSAPCYVSDIARLDVDVADIVKQARPLLEQGVLGVLVEVGSKDLQRDADRMEQLLEALGEAAWMGVTAQGRYDLGMALALAQFFRNEVAVDWFEEPLPADDHDGYQRLASRLETPLAVGSTFDSLASFREVLQRGEARILRPDVLQLGGITPFLKVAALAEAYHVTVAPYRLPEIGIHLACGLPNVQAVEYVSWLAPTFEEPVRIEKGQLAPRNVPGLGLNLKAQ